MIGYLEGQLLRKGENNLIIVVNGVGYDVHLGPQSLFSIGEPGSHLKLEIYTHVTESSLQLFGFSNFQQKRIFQKLISVSGIGPKLGLTIVDTVSIPQLIQAITTGDSGSLTAINGIGKKTAERIVIELRDKFNDNEFKIMNQTMNDVANDNLSTNNLDSVKQALVSLGYSEQQARRAVNGLQYDEEDSLQTLIKKSLAQMAQ